MIDLDGVIAVPDCGVVLPGAWNSRDVASGVSGLCARRVWRASQLTDLDECGQALMGQWAISDVVDLRTVQERTHHGRDRLARSICLHSMPFEDSSQGSWRKNPGDMVSLLEDNSENITQMKKVAYQYMLDEYRRFPLLEGAHRAIRGVIDLLSQGHSVMVHCLAGKDRTGFVIAMILRALECDDTTIMEEYLRSNSAIDLLRCKILRFVSASSNPASSKLVEFVQSSCSDVLWGVREEYLLTAYQVIDTYFGSVQQYFDHIQLSDEQRICLGQQLWVNH